MATSKEYLNFILEQLSPLDGVTHRQMMGEFILYYHGKIAAYLCDGRLLVKPTEAAKALLPHATWEPPYDGAKDMLLVDDVDDRSFLCTLFNAMLPELPGAAYRELLAKRSVGKGNEIRSGKMTRTADAIDIIRDKTRQPSAAEIGEYINTPLFDELCRYMEDEYQALRKIEYSGDQVLLGWNMKFKKAGKTLCTVYPARGRFSMLLVVGPKEKPWVEERLPTFSDGFQRIYRETKEGMGQRWLLLPLETPSALYDDALRVICIRRRGR